MNKEKLSRYNFNKLFKKMIDCGIRKGELARKAGIPYAYISRLENRQTVSFDAIMKIAQAMNCSIEDIVDIEDEMDD